MAMAVRHAKCARPVRSELKPFWRKKSESFEADLAVCRLTSIGAPPFLFVNTL